MLSGDQATASGAISARVSRSREDVHIKILFFHVTGFHVENISYVRADLVLYQTSVAGKGYQQGRI